MLPSAALHSPGLAKGLAKQPRFDLRKARTVVAGLVGRQRLDARLLSKAMERPFQVVGNSNTKAGSTFGGAGVLEPPVPGSVRVSVIFRLRSYTQTNRSGLHANRC